ncbi:MAG: hypothetical protein RL322_2842 [Pseudomonadota bacterium]|jgi:uncharacterized protein (DUF1330 family)
MSKGYLIGQLTVRNAAGYTAYSSQVQPTLEPFGGRFLVRGGDAVVLDGDPSGPRNVVIEFPSVQAARDWYRSAAYQAILQHRLDNADGYVLVVAGYEG